MPSTRSNFQSLWLKNKKHMRQNKQLRLGIDIGGTETKALVLDGNQIVFRDRFPTPETAEGILSGLVKQYHQISEKYAITFCGIGFPGSVIEGIVSTNNLPFNKYPVEEYLGRKIHCPFRIANDADCAGTGELLFGNPEGLRNFLLVTLGTGIGGCIIINGQVYSGRGCAGEFGMMTVRRGKKWEEIASVSALLGYAEKAVKRFPESLLCKYSLENRRDDGKAMSGQLFFRALKENCPVARTVFAYYIRCLAVGLENLDEIFSPEKIILSGGITAQGKQIMKEMTKVLRPGIPVRISCLENDAGALGAAFLPENGEKNDY